MISQSTPFPQIAPLGTILSVWAHPDDESWLAAGVMMAARANGQKVVCITATRGEEGVQDEVRWPHKHLGSIREKELSASMHIMDIASHYWLDYHDGQCPEVPSTQAVSKLLPFVKEVKPDTILTFGPDGFTGHDDHRTISKWVDLTMQTLDASQKKPAIFQVATCEQWYERIGREWDQQFDVFFNLDKPHLVPKEAIDLCFSLPDELLSRKLQALQAQPSQTAAMFTRFPIEKLRLVAGEEYFVRT